MSKPDAGLVDTKVQTPAGVSTVLALGGDCSRRGNTRDRALDIKNGMGKVTGVS